MVSHLNNYASDHSDIAIQCTIQDAAGILLARKFSEFNLRVVPEDESQEGF